MRESTILLGLLFACLFVISISCGGPTAQSNNKKEDIKLNLSLTGEELFVKHCKICHGVKGNLQLNGAKDLKESVMTLEERVVLITKGKNAMTPFEKILDEEEIKKVAAYTQSFAK